MMRTLALCLAASAAAWLPPAIAQTAVEELDTPFVVTPGNVVTTMLDLAGVRAGVTRATAAAATTRRTLRRPNCIASAAWRQPAPLRAPASG